MQIKGIENIYVRLLEGPETWVSVTALYLGGDVFEIKDNRYLDLMEDASSIWEFFPGDIVKCTKRGDDLVASELISSKFPNRRLHQLIFLIVEGLGDVTLDQLHGFESELNQLCPDMNILQKRHPVSEIQINSGNSRTFTIAFHGPGDPPGSTYSKWPTSFSALFSVAKELEIDFGVGPAIGLKVAGQTFEINLATFSFFTTKIASSNGKWTSTKSSLFQEDNVTQGIGIPFLNIQRKMVVGDPDAQRDSYTLGLTTQHFDRNGKWVGQDFGGGYGFKFIISIEIKSKVHYLASA